jgi:hypothetical protein
VVTTEQPFNKLFYTSPIYHSHYEQQHINLDSITLSTHQSSEGVNEETARIGRLLLENIHNLSVLNCYQKVLCYYFFF